MNASISAFKPPLVATAAGVSGSVPPARYQSPVDSTKTDAVPATATLDRTSTSVLLFAQASKPVPKSVDTKSLNTLGNPSAEDTVRARNVYKVLVETRKSFEGSAPKNDLTQFAKNVGHLRPDERRWLIDKMAIAKPGEMSLLSKVLTKISSSGSGLSNGFTEQEQKALLRDLIPGQSGKNIQRIFLGLEKNESGSFAPNPQKYILVCLPGAIRRVGLMP